MGRCDLLQCTQTGTAEREQVRSGARASAVCYAVHRTPYSPSGIVDMVVGLRQMQQFRCIAITCLVILVELAGGQEVTVLVFRTTTLLCEPKGVNLLWYL